MRNFKATGSGPYIGKTVEVWGLAKGGREFPITLTLAAWQKEEEQFVTGIIHDVGDRRPRFSHVEQTPAGDSHRLLTAITEGSTDPIFAKDTEHRYLMINSFAAKALNSTPDELVGKSDWEVLPPDLAPTIIETDRRIMETGETKILEEHVAGRVWLAKKWPLRDDAGKVIGLLGISRDITDLKLAEAGLKRAQKLSESLNRINATILSALDFERIIERIGIESAQAIGCDAAAIFLPKDGGWLLASAYGVPKLSPGTVFTANEVPQIAMIKKTKKPVALNEAEMDGEARAVMRRFGVSSVLNVPLIGGDEVIGVMGFAYTREPVRFTEIEIDFAEKLAVSVSLALENAHLYSTEKNIAQTLQEALLTVPEKIDKLDFGHIYRSSTVEAAKAGGDFYDIFEIEHNRVGIVIGDVSGKGLEASALTSLTKNTVKAYAFRSHSPAEIMDITNKLICRLVPGNIFITIFLGLLDKETGVLTYCNAGHPPPLVRKANGEVSTLTTQSPAAGVMPELTFRENRDTLTLGDMLICYTNGVIEARQEKELYGETRLANFVKAVKDPRPRTLPGLILHDITGFSTGCLHDDIAILTIARNNAHA